MTRVFAFALIVLTFLGVPLHAAGDDDDAGGFLVRFLEDTLSGDGRTVRVSGLEGAFSSRATIQSLTVSDDEGVWLTVNGAVLDWNRLALARGRFSVNSVGADEIIVSRAPGTTTTETALPTPEATPFQLPELPVAIELGEIHVDRFVLGKPLFGVAGELQVNGGLRLADGALDSRLTINRLDRPSDSVRLEALFENQTSRIALNLDLREEQGGLMSAILKLPGQPSVRFTAKGDGAITDFTADVSLASDGVERVDGQVRLRALAADTSATEETKGIGFAAELAGDITPLLPPEYHDFFGTGTRLDLDGQRLADGRMDVRVLKVASNALTLDGVVSIAADGTTEKVDVKGAILPPNGSEVILPISGPVTSLGAANFWARLDRSVGNDWAVAFEATNLKRPDVTVASARVAGAGKVGATPGEKIAGDISATLSGLGLADPALSQAVGDALSMDGAFAMLDDGRLRLTGIEARGADYRANLDGMLDGLDSGFHMDGTVRVGAADLSRFSGLAGKPLGGAVTAQITGTGAPLSGMFDIVLDARATDLVAGIEKVDPLIAGQTVLKLDAKRDETGTDIRAFEIDGTQVTAQARGKLSSGDSALSLSARLAELNLVVPQISGPLTLTADLERTGGAWGGEAHLKGPRESHADLFGKVAPDGTSEATFDATLSHLERFIPELAGSVEAKGKASRNASGRWTIAADASGPGGIRSDIGGTWDEATAMADLNARGQVRLNLANLFISPNSVQGDARFDLTLRGAPSLDAVGGSITTSGARFAIASGGQTIENIGATVTLARSRAQVAMSGQLRTGGGLSVNGAIGLMPPMDTNLTIDLNHLVLTDNISFRTSANGSLVFAGAILGNGSLSGQILFGETDINLAAVSGAAGAAPIPPMAHRAEPAPVHQTRARARLLETDANGSGPAIALDVRLIAQNRVYAHGFGLNAEMGGDILIRGTTARVEPSGNISLIRGTLNLFSRKLKLTKGIVTLQGDLTPYVEFQSTTSTSEGQATLEISGPIDAPEVKVFAEPERPSEEALAMLLFGNRFSQLSPLVIAQMAASFARLGAGKGPSSKLKDTTGVDSLDVGTDANGAGRVRAGAYLSENIYTDVTVNTEGETELNLNLSVTESLTVRGRVDNQGNTGLGLFFERDY